MLTTVVLFKGLNAPAMQIITLVMGFLVICVGITILQLSKVDPTQIKILDRRSTILLQAANARTDPMGDDEKSITAIEDPGLDALRGGGLGVVGSIVRARTARKWSKSSHGTARSRHGQHPPSAASIASSTLNSHSGGNNVPDHLRGLKRHQLYDAPVPRMSDAATISSSEGGAEHISMTSEFSSAQGPGSPRPSIHGGRLQTIRFGSEDVVHSYPKPGSRGDLATHEHRAAATTLRASASSPPPSDVCILATLFVLCKFSI